MPSKGRGIEAAAAQTFDVGMDTLAQRLQIEAGGLGRERVDLLHAAFEHAPGAGPQLLRRLVVTDRNLNESDEQVPQVVGHVVEAFLEHFMRFEVMSGIERARGIDHHVA